MDSIRRVAWITIVFLLTSLITSACNVAHDVTYSAHVWEDLDQDGQEDPGEKPLAGIVIQIVDPSNGLLWQRSITDSNGNIAAFSAGGTCGQYNIYISIPDDYWPTTQVVINTPKCEKVRFGLRLLP
jgi:hypothetical protein